MGTGFCYGILRVLVYRELDYFVEVAFIRLLIYIKHADICWCCSELISIIKEL